MAFGSDVNASSQAQFMVTGTGMPSQFMQILACDSIQPGSDIGYTTAKLIYVYHPMGAKISECRVFPLNEQGRLVHHHNRSGGMIGR